MTEQEKIETLRYIINTYPRCCNCSFDRTEDELLKIIPNNEWIGFVRWIEQNDIGIDCSGMRHNSPSIMFKDTVHLFLEQEAELKSTVDLCEQKRNDKIDWIRAIEILAALSTIFGAVYILF